MWDLPEPSEPSHESLVYLALRELGNANTAAALQAVQQGRNLLILSLANTTLEAATTIYIPLSRLQALQVDTNFWLSMHKSRVKTGLHIKGLGKTLAFGLHNLMNRFTFLILYKGRFERNPPHIRV